MDGILVINKPKGISSFHYLKKIQRKLSLKKVGHLGTLDPNASGVLVLLCGHATKLNQSLSGGTKVYQSVFRFGIETDTLDPEGTIVATSKKIPTRGQILDKMKTLVGNTEIEVPKFSAVHINGRRAYDLARAGIEFDAPKKNVDVLRFEMIDLDKTLCDITEHGIDNAMEVKEMGVVKDNLFAFEIECETGTYIRSLAKLLAEKLGTVAIAQEICRTAVGDFKIADAKTVETVTLFDLKQV